MSGRPGPSSPIAIRVRSSVVETPIPIDGVVENVRYRQWKAFIA